MFEAFANQVLNKRRPFCLSRPRHPQRRPCHDHGGRRGADRQHAGDGGLDGRRLAWATSAWVPGIDAPLSADGRGHACRWRGDAAVRAGAQIIARRRGRGRDRQPRVLLRAASDVPPTLRADRTLLRIDAVEHL